MTQPIVKFAMPLFGQSEKTVIVDVLEGARRYAITNGDRVAYFEEQFQKFLGGGIAVAVSSCMAALHLSLLAKGIGPGDEVIVPALTHVAMAHACELVGARPVFCDAHISSGNLDPDKLPYLITERTKAISIVHYLGQPAYARTLQSICRDRNILLIEDCALSLGVKHEAAGMTGLIGDAACFSFYPTKHITTAEGGMFVTRHPEYADIVKRMRRFGHAGRDDDIHMVGLNYRMTEIQAAIGFAQLVKLPAWQTKRRRNESMLRNLLKDYWIIGGNYALAVFVENRDEARRKLAAAGVETSVYYPRPVPHYSYYREKYGEQSFPVAEKICRETICIPVGPHLEEKQIRILAEEFRNCASPL
jgi:perosamine synthetase